MKKNEASNRFRTSRRRACVRRPTCYSVVAHPGDPTRTIAAHYRVSLVAKVKCFEGNAWGEDVEKGHVIGTAGTTGEVERPQLHFEIRRGITPMDLTLLLAASS